MLNRDVYQIDPLRNELANNGVAVVNDDMSESAMQTLRYELETFVCDGHYQEGLDSILSTYLSNLKKGDAAGEGAGHQQPGVWVSGFFGSGKSHLVKMLRTLWVDQPINNGQTARQIADLPQEVADHLVELTTLSRRFGGLHAASGTLGAGANHNVRLALLAIVFRSAGLPEQYHQARFVMWLKREGVLDKVRDFVEAEGDSWLQELDDMFVSRSIARALSKVFPDFGDDVKKVRELLKANYPIVTDVSNTQMVNAISDALERDGKFPLTLIVLDEVQQYVGNEPERAHLVQEVVETCCDHSKFAHRLLFVGTGQSALSGMPNLQRLMGRFQVPVMLKDTDVETVIRKVVLQKNESARGPLETFFSAQLGEISSHLAETGIKHVDKDERELVADYPVLPTRLRFWRHVLRIVDTTGTAAQLRNQLKIMHEAVKGTAGLTLGNMVPGDFIYHQIASNLLQTGVISKDIYETIARLGAGDDSQKLQSRLMSLILLIGKLPLDPQADIGVRATADMLSDLLIDDFTNGKDVLRAEVPKALAALVKDGLLMEMEGSAGIEYRLQTQESVQWYDRYRQQEAELRGNLQRVDSLRIDRLHAFVNQELGKVRLVQGVSAQARQITPCYDQDLPRDANERIYLWVLDGQTVTESQFQDEARRAALEMPTIYLYIPSRNRSELISAIISQRAAELTIEILGVPSTGAGKDAYAAMQTRAQQARRHVDELLKEVFGGVIVCQAGGSLVQEATVAKSIEKAAQASMIRLYREFDIADHAGWGKVYDRATKEGGQNALEAVGHKDDTEKHPVCAKMLRYIGVSKKGNEIRDEFSHPPYGWSQDAIDGALYALLAANVLKAEDAGRKSVTALALERKKLTQVTFFPETISIRPVDLIKLRGLLNAVGVPCGPQEDAVKIPQLVDRALALAQKAGGEAPAPKAPDTQLFNELAVMSGNSQIKAVLDRADTIKALIAEWEAQAGKLDARYSTWNALKQLHRLSRGLIFHDRMEKEIQAIISHRSLLEDPDPVAPLLADIEKQLREAIQHHVKAWQDEFARQQAALEQDAHWQKINDDQRRAILSERGLVVNEAPRLSSRDDVIDSLESCALEQWQDRTDALASKFESARQEAVRLLQPRVQHVSLPRRTFENEAQIREWLDEVETVLKTKLAEGPVMV